MGIEGVATAPYRIETDRLVIRCYDPAADAPLLKEAIDSSIDHLAPWMPWAQFEPQTLAEKVELLRRFRAGFDADENYTYGVFARDESRLLGGSGLHPRGGPASLEIGYWIRADALRQGYAAELTAVLTRAAFEICSVERVDIQIDPENERSAGVPRKLGFTHEGTLRRRLPPKKEGGARRDDMLFTMVREELAASPCAAYEYVAYDVTGRRL
ncbi:MAG TPA: GNAT family protein [Gaiellaceae bacterium]|nr:GNAT family protein [Gaiellaceae bacterium]